MQIQLRYFASLREALGPGEKVELPAGMTVAAVRDLLVARVRLQWLMGTLTAP